MIFDVAIVGGGAAGVLAAIHLQRTSGPPLRIALIEKAGVIGTGVAYATQRTEHLLNVTAGRMSAFDADPGHFVRHLAAQSPSAASIAEIESTFVERRHYAAYLRATLAQEQLRSRCELHVIHDEVVALEGRHQLRLALRAGDALQARAVILALGNWPRGLPLSKQQEPAATYLLQGWDHAGIAALDATQDVLMVGSGLSMVDAVLTLASNRHRGAIHVVSRHALFPLPHALHGEIPLDLDAFSTLSVARRATVLRLAARSASARGEPWQWVMDTLRNRNPRLWTSLSIGDQRRFLRHVARYWDVHRHRIPPVAAAVVDGLLRSGQLVRHAGRCAAITQDGDRQRVEIESRSSAGRQGVLVERVINCAGMQSDVRLVRDDLMKSLLATGMARRGPHGIGLDTDPLGALVDLQQTIHPRVFTLGSARIGQLWESVAIPELRTQAEMLANHLDELLGQVRGREAS